MKDIRFQRIEQEYKTLRETQGNIIDSLEQLLPAITNGVSENRTLLLRHEEMLLAIIKHLDVPYKPPMGFNPKNDE